MRFRLFDRVRRSRDPEPGRTGAAKDRSGMAEPQGQAAVAPGPTQNEAAPAVPTAVPGAVLTEAAQAVQSALPGVVASAAPGAVSNEAGPICGDRDRPWMRTWVIRQPMALGRRSRAGQVLQTPRAGQVLQTSRAGQALQTSRAGQALHGIPSPAAHGHAYAHPPMAVSRSPHRSRTKCLAAARPHAAIRGVHQRDVAPRTPRHGGPGTRWRTRAMPRHPSGAQDPNSGGPRLMRDRTAGRAAAIATWHRIARMSHITATAVGIAAAWSRCCIGSGMPRRHCPPISCARSTDWPSCLRL